MTPTFDFDKAQQPAGRAPYNPADYGLPVWRDEDHLPPQETAEAKQEPSMEVPAPVSTKPSAPGAIERAV